MKVNYAYEKPPIFDRLFQQFGIDWNNIIITYGDTIYSREPISIIKNAHEMVHVKQQEEMGRDRWWELYFDNPRFRLLQETEAYQAEAKFIKTLTKDREKLYKALKGIRLDITSSIYGNMCTYEEAKQLIQ